MEQKKKDENTLYFSHSNMDTCDGTDGSQHFEHNDAADLEITEHDGVGGPPKEEYDKADTLEIVGCDSADDSPKEACDKADSIEIIESDRTDGSQNDDLLPDTDSIHRIVVSPNVEGMRFDRFLSVVFPDLSRSRLQELIKERLATVDGKAVKSSRKLTAGEEVVLKIPDPEEPEILPEDIPLSILYEDTDILIVDKPKNMAVHPAPGHSSGTLVNAVMYHCRDNLSGINGVLRPGIVHRIDMDTTGALIICKNDTAHRKIAEQLSDHSITRRYLGIVCGNIREDTGTIEGNIGRDPRNRKKMAVVKNGGKPAVTHFRVLERFGSYTLCEFTLETGRTHQIRVHMASKGHPLLGDAVYGSGRSPFSLLGQTLHAAVIGFIHPRTGEYVEFEAPLPEYFERVLGRLRGNHS